MNGIQSLHGRLIIASGIAVSLTLAAFGYIYVQQQNRALESFHIQVFSRRSQSIMEAFSAEMARGGMDSVRQILSHEVQDPNLADIKLINSQGRIVISTSGLEGPSNLNLAVLDTVFQKDSRYSHREGKVLSIVNPIGNSARCHRCHSSADRLLGYLEVSFRFDPSERSYTGLLSSTIGFAMLFVVLLSVTLWYLQHRFVRRPIARLKDAIQGAMDGDLSVRVDVSGSDEIGRLTASFNQLISRLDKAQKELKAFHDRKMEMAERLATAGELASGIAHEIKNPLAGISSTLQVKLESTPEDSPDREILTEMAVQVRRIDKAVRDLLSYACPPEPEFKTGDLNERIKRCTSFISPVAELQNTAIRIQLQGEIPELLLDATLLDQVLVNILMNALQALRTGGTILVTSEFEPTEQIAEVCIADNGPGLPDDLKDKVFRPFFTTKHKGSGLGLSICKKNVERHLGTIEVESELGAGTKFIIRLPVNTTFKQLLDQQSIP